MTFTRKTKTRDAATDVATVVTSTIEGDGILMAGGPPQQYVANGLVQSAFAWIGFTPSTYPLAALTTEFVLPGDKAVINGITFTVQGIIRLVALDGYVVYSRIAVGV